MRLILQSIPRARQTVVLYLGLGVDLFDLQIWSVSLFQWYFDSYLLLLNADKLFEFGSLLLDFLPAIEHNLAFRDT